MNTINRPTIIWPDSISESHRARIEVKALGVFDRYDLHTIRDAAGNPTGQYNLTPKDDETFFTNPYGYMVDASAAPTSCTCPGFQSAGICSHALAVADHLHMEAWADDMGAALADYADDQAGRVADAAERTHSPAPIPTCAACTHRTPEPESLYCEKCLAR